MAYEAFHPPVAPAIGSTAAVQAALLKEIGKQLVGTVGGDPMAVGQVVQAKVSTDVEGKPTLMLGGTKVPAQLPANVSPGQVLQLQVKESSPERVVLQIVKGPDGAPLAAPPQAAALPGANAGGAMSSAPGARTLAALGSAVAGGAAVPSTGAGAATTAPLSSAAAAASTATAAAAATSDLGAAQQAQQPTAVAAQAAATVVPWAVIPMPGGAQARIWLDPEGSAEEPGAQAAARRRTMVVRYDSPVLGRTDVVLNLDAAILDAHVLAPAGQSLDLIRHAVGDLRLALAGAVDRPVAIVTGGRAGEDIDLRA
ncbi:MAG: flagellar hook-length control protein FliK [Solirubrobacteraceae bacterium]|nr:flagellar hook-length control protein FliK [Solirubrobacteraceae bacterium]